MFGIEQEKRKRGKACYYVIYFNLLQNLLKEILCLLIIFIKFRSAGENIFGRTHFKDLING